MEKRDKGKLPLDKQKFSVSIMVDAKRDKKGNIIPLTVTERKELRSMTYDKLQHEIDKYNLTREKYIRNELTKRLVGVNAAIEEKRKKIVDKLIEFRHQKVKLILSINSANKELEREMQAYSKIKNSRAKSAEERRISCKVKMHMLSNQIKNNEGILETVNNNIDYNESLHQDYYGDALEAMKEKARKRIYRETEALMVKPDIDNRTWHFSFSVIGKANKISCVGVVYTKSAKMEVCNYETLISKRVDLGHKATMSEKEAMVEDFMAYCEREGIELIEDSITIRLANKMKLAYSVSGKQPHKTVFEFNRDVEIWELYRINSDTNDYPMEYAGTFSIPGSVRRNYERKKMNAEYLIHEMVNNNFMSMIKSYRMHPERYIFKQALVLE